MTTRRLYRSRTDRQLAGVAGGMAEYFDVDPTIVRILWIASVFIGGFTLLLYPVMAFIVPLAPVRPMGPAGAATAAGMPGDATADGSSGLGETGTGELAGEAGAGSGWTSPVTGFDRAERRGPGGAVYLGVLLVVFGILALADSVFPGWIGHASAGPAVIVALGAMLLVGAARRPTADR